MQLHQSSSIMFAIHLTHIISKIYMGNKVRAERRVMLNVCKSWASNGFYHFRPYSVDLKSCSPNITATDTMKCNLPVHSGNSVINMTMWTGQNV